MSNQPNSDVLNLDTKRTTTNQVFVPNLSGHDFSDANRYGELKFVTYGEVNRFSIGHIARKWAAALVSSKPEDHLLVTSLTILTVIGAAIFGHLHGRLNILIFRNGKYISRTIILSELIRSQKESLK